MTASRKPDVIIEKNGKYWGEVYSDSYATENGWIEDPELAFQYDSRFATKPLDCVSPLLLNREKLMQGARFVKFHEETKFTVEK